ncbi:UvrD-helicase domain-containing protein [Christiangramia sabulilitoris]|uniref:RecBCD enzyme subunit RecB n=1 Tax=Christiangramia sabulilitoris TaxID=2583991 RepID=A0A550I7L0_9FLAO|nr:UvrD-helicase domain-containing protein [Christiangramia sabulilitoris]TRO66959.1 AAA family ATPase [Christiangramia sabulilitoris]
MENFNPLDKTTVKLEGSNLVEASAGTGKTYSIGLLVLRLLLEKDLKISQILMVTFTNQAVAELAARIRKFLLLGIKAAESKEVEKPIAQLIATYPDKDLVISKLKEALSQLDEASIQTIHSFCQDSLINHALDSGQPFGLDLQTNVLEIANEVVKKYWREEISGFQPALFQEVEELSLENFQKVIKESLGGKTYALLNEEVPVFEDFVIKYEKFKNEYIEKKDTIISNLVNIEEANLGAHANNNAETFIQLANSFSGYCTLISRENPQYYARVSNHFFADDKMKLHELKEQKKPFCHYFICQCIRKVEREVQKHLQEKHLITYDELINRMHKEVVVKKNQDLKEKLRGKYEAIFIDEFQDTDKLQYDIYNELFGKGKILFYIGDPKQSIYGWRKADLNTYFAARKNVNRRFQMNRNFRSSKTYIDDINSFFLGADNPFETEVGGENHIEYFPVEANNEESTGLSKKDGSLSALQSFDFDNQDQIKDNVLRLVNLLLHGCEAPWNEAEKGIRKVKASDIAILVRYNSQARELKQKLTAAGIPAVTIDDTKVFQEAPEVKFLLYILGAILYTTESNINKALLNSISGYSSEEINKLDKDLLVDKFREYRDTWVKSGVFAAIKKYMAQFSVVERLMKKNDLRSLTNFNQILEIIQEAEFRQQLKPTGVYEFLQKKISEPAMDIDEYQQRVESDENAVKLLTIHTAKGLEFPIVIAPFLDLQANETHDYCSYRDEEGIYKFYPKKKGDNAMTAAFEDQLKQENRRLLYVALTRAKYHSFIFENKHFKDSSLKDFLKKWENTSQVINLEEEVEILSQENNLGENFGKASEANFKLNDLLYGKLSFSGISVHGTYTPKENTGKPEGYDQFIFKDIPKGTTLGDMLHQVFENIDFGGSPDHHKEELEKLLDRYYPHKKAELSAGFMQMINHVLDSNISIGGEQILLRKISNGNKKNEMEFDLQTQWVDLVGLNEFDAGEGIDIHCNTQNMAKSGLLNGFIDLLLKHNGKYYILDWKSNYLGDHLSYYDGEEKMREAMNEGNYHLQYFIYSMALKNYLEQRLPNFNYERDFGGVIYIYLRGARAGKNTGIYTNKPTLEQVETLESLFRKEQLA